MSYSYAEIVKFWKSSDNIADLENFTKSINSIKKDTLLLNKQWSRCKGVIIVEKEWTNRFIYAELHD